MADLAPFRADKAAHIQFGDLHTDFILPICMPDPELIVGQDLAVLVAPPPVEGRRASVLIAVRGLKSVQGVIA